MSKTDFWLTVAAWYLLLGGLLLAAVNRFGSEYMLRTLMAPSAKIIVFLVLFLLPIPLILRRRS